MKRVQLALASIALTGLMAGSAFAQGAVQRDGTDAGGPRNAMRAASEMAPAKKTMKRRAARGSKMTTGSTSRRLHEKSGTDAGGPRTQGIPGQIR
jgi:hypothetical protein